MNEQNENQNRDEPEETSDLHVTVVRVEDFVRWKLPQDSPAFAMSPEGELWVNLCLFPVTVAAIMDAAADAPGDSKVTRLANMLLVHGGWLSTLGENYESMVRTVRGVADQYTSTEDATVPPEGFGPVEVVEA